MGCKGGHTIGEKKQCFTHETQSLDLCHLQFYAKVAIC